jgi:hypothetical protein
MDLSYNITLVLFTSSDAQHSTSPLPHHITKLLGPVSQMNVQVGISEIVKYDNLKDIAYNVLPI